MQIVHCECGESSMLDGRCVGCKRVRPSSKEVKESIAENKKRYENLLEDLIKAKELEKKDENMC